jgi:CheY-like chemotaxis protein
MREILTDAGYHVVSAYDGLEGLARLAEQRVGLIVCDETIPRLNGIEFCNQLADRPDFQAFPIILASGYAAPSSAARHYAAFLPKPFDLDQLLAAVEGVLSPIPKHEKPAPGCPRAGVCSEVDEQRRDSALRAHGCPDAATGRAPRDRLSFLTAP